MTGTLFELEQYSSIKSVYDARAKHDPYWDEIVLDCSGSEDKTGQLTLFYDDSSEPPDPGDFPSHDDYIKAFNRWRENFPEQDYIFMKSPDGDFIDTLPEQDNSVLEDEVIRVSELPEQPSEPLPEHRKTQWVEEYSVKRSGTKHWYYRYCYYAKRKIYHIHIPGGNYQSAVAQSRKEMIEKAIALGKTPREIENFIRGGFGMNGNKLLSPVT